MESICSICKKRKRVYRNHKTGKPICSNCYQKARYHDPSMREKCSKCGEVKPVAIRTGSGKPICGAYYNRGEVGRSAKRKETKVI